MFASLVVVLESIWAMCSVFFQSSGGAQAGFVDTWCDPESVERCYSQRSVNAQLTLQSTLQSTLAEMYKNVQFGESLFNLH